MQTIEDLLAASPIFAGMPADHLALVAGCAQNTGFAAGDYVFHEGEPADTFYVLRRGAVALEMHGPGGGLTIDTIVEGEVLGWSWLFPPCRWHFDARAIEPVRALAFDGACLRGKAEADPALGYDLMGRFAEVIVARLQATRMRLLDLYGAVAAD